MSHMNEPKIRQTIPTNSSGAMRRPAAIVRGAAAMAPQSRDEAQGDPNDNPGVETPRRRLGQRGHRHDLDAGSSNERRYETTAKIYAQVSTEQVENVELRRSK